MAGARETRAGKCRTACVPTRDMAAAVAKRGMLGFYARNFGAKQTHLLDPEPTPQTVLLSNGRGDELTRRCDRDAIDKPGERRRGHLLDASLRLVAVPETQAAVT